MAESESDICVNGYNFLLSAGNGSIGSVFKASKDKKYYAIKMINMNQIENLHNFVLLMQKLQDTDKANPNVVRVFEFFQNPLNLFISMEYCNQGNLLQYMCKQPNRRLDSYKAVDLFAQILNGFKFLHANNIEHRNLKPQNILMHDGKPKITDYGIYMIYRGKEATYQMREFLSPENYEHQSDSISHLCDIWGLGVLFFFMLFGTWPFKDFEEIKKYTHNTNVKNPFNLDAFVKDKAFELPSIFQNVSQDFFTMISEIFAGIFVYENKNRMTFAQLCKHRIFLKIKNFNMEESFLFYLQAEKSLIPSPKPHKGSFNAQTLAGLPGVSARSMYSGDVEEITEKQSSQWQNLGQVRRSSSKKVSQINNYPMETLELAQDLTSAIDLNAQNRDIAYGQDLALGLDLGKLFPKLRQQVPSFNQMIISVNSEVGQKDPNPNNNNNNTNLAKNICVNNDVLQKYYRPSVNLPDNEGFSFITEGAHYSPMALSSFSKMKVTHKKNQEGTLLSPRQTQQHKQSCSPQRTCMIESESDFENIEEFDSQHKEVNNIPEFCILKACKMVDFQFKTNQDPYLKQIDSYCLSSVISIPRPYPYPNQETDNQKRSISTLYDLEIYRYRFIEETIRLVKNAYYDLLQPLIGYSQIILAEYVTLKMSFYLSKTLLTKIEKNENFLKVDPADFIKFQNGCYHLRFVDILQKDLERIFTQFYLSQTLIKNQDIKQPIDEQEQRFFFFECSPVNFLQEVHSSFEESENNNDNSPVIQIQNSFQQHKQQLQETPSFQGEVSPNVVNTKQISQVSCQTDRAKVRVSSQNEKVQSRVSCEADRAPKIKLSLENNNNNNKKPKKQLLQQGWDELKGELTFSITHSSKSLDPIHVKELDHQFTLYLNNIFNALKARYKSCLATQQEEQSKILKLALRVAICCRYQDAFDKNQMESILIFFEKSENQNNNNSQNNSSSNFTSHILSNNNNSVIQNNTVSQLVKGVNLGTSLSASNVLAQRTKKQQQQSSQQFSIEALLKWINSCSKQEIIRQIFLLVDQQL